MKLNKAQFKKILKECIRELIDDGAFNTVIKESVGPAAMRPNTRPAANDFASSYGGEEYAADAPAAFSAVGHMSPNARLQEISRLTAAQASGGDPQQAKMMESIFADTAQTTLQNMIGNEGGGHGMYTGEPTDPQEEQQEMAVLDVLSGGKGAKHWAALAFGKYNK